MRVFMTVFITALFDPEEDWRTGKYALICNKSTPVLIALYQVAQSPTLEHGLQPFWNLYELPPVCQSLSEWQGFLFWPCEVTHPGRGAAVSHRTSCKSCLSPTHTHTHLFSPMGISWLAGSWHTSGGATLIPVLLHTCTVLSGLIPPATREVNRASVKAN